MEVFEVTQNEARGVENRDLFEVKRMLHNNEKTDLTDSSSSSTSEDDEESTRNKRNIKKVCRPPPKGQRNVRKMSTPGGISSSNNYNMTCLERLIRTHPIWFLPKVNRDEAMELLSGKESGAFIVRQSSQSNTLALSVRLCHPKGDIAVEHYLIQQSETSPSKLNLESSEHSFDNVLSLVYHYTTQNSEEELVTSLLLPSSLRDSNSRQHLSSVALLGKDYWKYPMSQTPTSEKKVKPKVPPSSPVIASPRNPRRKLSEPINHSHEATATLEETLNGLQKVSDMLQASLKDLEDKPIPPPRVSSSPRTQRKDQVEMDSTEMLRSNQPIVQLRSKLSEEMFGGSSTVDSSSTKQWYSYYRSSIADKISDYEDIWEKSERCLSPAESELQFKAYLASKLTDEANLPDSQSSSSSEDEFEPQSSSSTGLSSLNSSTESLRSTDASVTSSFQENESEEVEVIYSDPLDALEKAEDTRIYNCPEFGEIVEEVIYEEAGKKLEITKGALQSPKRRKRATISSSDAPVIKVEEKVLQRRSHSYVQQTQPKFSRGLSSVENKRLSAVVSKYFKPIAKQTWQMDSSSWEFLNQIDTSTSDKSKHVDSGLDSTLSFTNKSDDKDSLYESELGTLNTQQTETEPESQLSKTRDKIKDYVTNQLTAEKYLFGKMITQFLDCTVGSQPIFNTLRNVRQFMNGMKNYLIRHGEGDLHNIINEERTKLNPDEFLNVDLLLEETMHSLIIGPLTCKLRESLRVHLSSNPGIQGQASNEIEPANLLRLSKQTKNAFEECFIQMRNAVSPLDKLAHLLTGLKVITNAVGEKEMSDLNAEKFCWLLAHLLSELEMTDWIEVDLELLWNLLPQSVLRGLSNGEATYYLTLVSSAANINRNTHNLSTSQLKLEVPTTNGASGTSSSLKSSSSTTSGNGTASSVMLTVTIPNNDSLVSKNVPLRNDTAKVKDVCTLLTHMLAISSPNEYTLFSIVDGKESLLQEDEKPLLIVDQARLQGKNFCAFAYQRKDSQNAWPSQMGIDLSKP